jgi:hypothetical protein
MIDARKMLRFALPVSEISLEYRGLVSGLRDLENTSRFGTLPTENDRDPSLSSVAKREDTK